jgi:hypothetical protein
MLYVMAQALGMDQNAKRLGDILRADDQKDDRTGNEILEGVRDKIRARIERRSTDAGGN